MPSGTKAAAAAASAAAAAAATKKRRCWQFHVSGVSRSGTKAQHQSALASFNDKYTAAKRLTIIPAPADPNATPRERIDGTPSATAGHNSREPHATADAGGNNGGGDGGGSSGIVVVEVQFSGPQPAERPALLLQNLLGGKSVAAHPVLLRRGRSKKPTEADAAAAGGRAGEGAGASVEVSRSTGALVDANGNVIYPSSSSSSRNDLKRTATGANLSSPRTNPEDDDEDADKNDKDLRGKLDVGFPADSGNGKGCRSSSGGGGDRDGENEMLLSDLDMDDADDDEDDAPAHAVGHRLLCGAWDRCLDLSTFNPVDEGSDMVVPDAELAGGAARVQCGCNCDDLVVCNCRDKTAGLDWSINPRATNADTTTKATGTTTTTITAAGGSGSNLLSPHRRSWSDTNLLRASGTVVPTREKMPTLLTRAPPAPTLRRRRSSHNMASPGVVGTGHVSRGPGSSSSVRNGGGSKMQKGAPWNGSHVEDFLAEGVAEREAVGFEEPPRRFGWGERVGAATAAAEGRAPGNEQPQQQEFSWRRRRRRRREGQDDGSGAISVEPLLEEFDFEGHPAKLYNPMDSPFAEAFSVPRGEEQYLVFTGLAAVTDEPLHTLAARVRFSVADREVTRETGSLQAGANGRVYGAVNYPSMKELWPEIYNTAAVRVVEVKLVVDVRPRDGHPLRINTELKAMYRRPQVRGRSYEGAQWRP